jgi:subfamily B ATP-binding cassette protein MsbA
VGAMLWVVAPVKNLSRLNNVIQESIASAQRVFAILDIPEEPLRHGRGGVKATLEREIRFENVSFEYVPGREVLRNVSFAVRPGEVVALAGPSGAGKTTLVDLIPRFYIPTSGRILMDGVDTREFDLKSLRGLMGIVTQETILFNDTVRNNVAYGQRDFPMERLIAASKAANAHEFISALPQGYDTVIGERGEQLSGGQRQRIAIARAILRDPQLLIFDEATSALDTESEILVQDAIDRLLEGRTTFVIAHRLSTIQNADRILFLVDGEIREFGTHEQLMHSNGAYKKLYDLQFGYVS